MAGRGILIIRESEPREHQEEVEKQLPKSTVYLNLL